MRGLNNILKNKNTVTILGIVVIVFLLFIGFNATINSTVNPVSVPVAKRKILPGTQIKQDDVKYTNVSRIVLSDNVLTNLNDILLKYSNYNVTIPENSMFYKEWLVGEGDLPGNWLKKIDFSKGEEAYYYKVDVESTYGNSILPDSYIDIYMGATINKRTGFIYGKLLKNIKVLAVHNSKGKNVFDDSENIEEPSYILFALSKDNYNLLTRAQYAEKYLENEDLILKIAPQGKDLPSDDKSVKVNRSTLIDYINAASKAISNDELQNVE